MMLMDRGSPWPEAEVLTMFPRLSRTGLTAEDDLGGVSPCSRERV
jgi:hypothetical protein